MSLMRKFCAGMILGAMFFIVLMALAVWLSPSAHAQTLADHAYNVANAISPGEPSDWLGATSWFLIASVLAAFWLTIGFFMLPVLQKLHDDKTLYLFPWWVLVILALTLILGLISDPVFNIVGGSLIFRELPRFKIRWFWRMVPIPQPEMFTWRVQRHVDLGDDSGATRKWSLLLTTVVKDHIKHIPLEWRLA